MVDRVYAWDYIKYINQLHLSPMNNSIFTPSTPHYVYIINQEDLQNNKLICKIGYTKDANQRIKGLQTGSDKKLRVFQTFLVAYNRYDANRIEKQIQKMFTQFKREGEWFAFDPVHMVTTVLPQIEKFVNDLDVKDEPLPITEVANTLMTKEQYLATKCRQYVLNRKSELTVEEQLEKVIVDSALTKERNLEKMLSKAKAIANRK